MGNDTKNSTVHWLMIIFISIAFAVFTNVLLFFIALIFVQVDGDGLATWYLGGDNHYFLWISMVLVVLYIPLVRKIPSKLE
jgi:hypothetical protein